MNSLFAVLFIVVVTCDQFVTHCIFTLAVNNLKTHALLIVESK